jgi:hypothetical protein
MPNPGAVASQTGQCRMGVSRGRDEGGSHRWYRVDTSSRQVRWEVFMGIDYGPRQRKRWVSHPLEVLNTSKPGVEIRGAMRRNLGCFTP